MQMNFTELDIDIFMTLTQKFSSSHEMFDV